MNCSKFSCGNYVSALIISIPIPINMIGKPILCVGQMDINFSGTLILKTSKFDAVSNNRRTSTSGNTAGLINIQPFQFKNGSPAGYNDNYTSGSYVTIMGFYTGASSGTKFLIYTYQSSSTNISVSWKNMYFLM